MKRLFCLVVLVCCAAPLAAQTPLTLTIDGSTAEAEIALPGGIEADLTIDFEQVLGLSEASLGLSASLIDPLDPGLLARLPDPTDVSLPAAFPMLIQISPPATGPLSFTGVVKIEVHTHNLGYVAMSPLRLLAAPKGGLFEDITNWAGSGSYRVGGSKGGFSEFLIATDLRSGQEIIDHKFAALQHVLDENSATIDPDVLTELQEMFNSAWAWRQSLDYIEAATTVDNFIEIVKSHSGSEIPDVWRSSGDLVNVAGELRQAATTLRFTLHLTSRS